MLRCQPYVLIGLSIVFKTLFISICCIFLAYFFCLVVISFHDEQAAWYVNISPDVILAEGPEKAIKGGE
jgi:hypothetical protein